MNPTRLQTRTHLLEYIKEHAPRSAVRRAIDEGQVEVLGAFSALPPHTDPGFIVVVTSKHGKSWPVAVAIDEIKHTYRVVILDDIPWSNWDGKLGRYHPVHDGDSPLASNIYRNRAIIYDTT